MSLQQRVSERTSSETLQPALLRAMKDVPHAAGVAVAHAPDGARGVLVINASGEDFDAAERIALDRLREVQRRFGDLAVDLVCIPAAEADAIDIPSAMETYRYTNNRFPR